MANSLAAFNAEMWSKLLIMNLDRQNIMINKVDRRYEGEISGAGSVVKVRTLGNIVTGDYTSGTTITYQGLSPTIETLTVDVQKFFAYKLDDVERVQNDMDLLQLYAGRGAQAMSEKVDDEILATYSSAHTDNRITSGGSPITLTSTTAGTSVYDNLVAAGVALSNKNAPLMNRWAIIDPHTHGLLQKDTSNFSRATDAGDRLARTGMLGGEGPGDPGFVGACAGFALYLTTALPRNGSTGKYIMYGQGDPIKYVGKIQSFQTILLESSFETAIRGLLVHKAKVFTEDTKRLGYIYAAIGS